MKDAPDVGPGGVDGSVQTEANLVDAEVGGSRVEDLALHVHFEETGRGDLVVEHAVRHDEEVLQLLVDASLEHRQMVVFSEPWPKIWGPFH